MPPRKRKPATAAARPDPEDAASPLPSDGSRDGDFDDQPQQSMPFFNVTYTTHRASPLHVGSESLSTSRLQLLSRRLRDTLVGDVVRGVQVGLAAGDDGSLGRAGALESVEWRWVRWDDLLGISHEDGEQEGSREGSLDLGAESSHAAGGGRRRPAKGRKALCLELNYENAYFTASLLPSLNKDKPPKALAWNTTSTGTEDKSETSKAFMHLPLLLLRMPAPLRSVVCEFLSSNFDCRISPLHLGTQSLVRMWETWLLSSRTGRGGAKVGKDVVITLGFHLDELDKMSTEEKGEGAEADQPEDREVPASAPHGLRSIDVIIPAAHVARFLRAGRRIDPRVGNQQPSIRGKRKRSANIFASASATRTKAEKEHLTRLRRRIAGDRSEEGWSWRSEHAGNNMNQLDDEDAYLMRTNSQPFTEAVAAYLSQHLALDMFHPVVRITKIACGGFVAAESGRLKIFTPASSSTSRAVQKLVVDLGDQASSAGAVAAGVGQDAGQASSEGPWSRAAVRIAEMASAAA